MYIRSHLGSSHFGSSHLLSSRFASFLSTASDVWIHGGVRRLGVACILVVVAAGALMPHLHSAAARERRRNRAIQKGFVVARVGQAWIQVDKQVRKAALVAARSLELHRLHDEMCGAQHHRGRLASLQASAEGLLSPDLAKEAARTHRSAGRLKHSISKQPVVAVPKQPCVALAKWADTNDDDGPADSWEELVAPPLPCVENQFGTTTGVQNKVGKAGVENIDGKDGVENMVGEVGVENFVDKAGVVNSGVKAGVENKVGGNVVGENCVDRTALAPDGVKRPLSALAAAFFPCAGIVDPQVCSPSIGAQLDAWLSSVSSVVAVADGCKEVLENEKIKVLEAKIQDLQRQIDGYAGQLNSLQDKVASNAKLEGSEKIESDVALLQSSVLSLPGQVVGEVLKKLPGFVDDSMAKGLSVALGEALAPALADHTRNLLHAVGQQFVAKVDTEGLGGKVQGEVALKKGIQMDGVEDLPKQSEGKQLQKGSGGSCGKVASGLQNGVQNDLHDIVIGEFVTWEGLEKASHLNGKTGQVEGYDKESMRLIVQVQGIEGKKRLCRENLRRR